MSVQASAVPAQRAGDAAAAGLPARGAPQLQGPNNDVSMIFLISSVVE